MKHHPRIVVDLIRQYADSGVGAEIGVWKGETSNHILTATKTKTLYMIDQYKKNYDSSQSVYSAKENPDTDYKKIKASFETMYPDRHKLIRKSSIEAAEELQIELDFIFIDANHTYEYVIQDLRNWVPKIKSGGLIMGHDWWYKFPGVITAVIEYANESESFVMPSRAKPLNKLPGKIKYIPAPHGSPVVLKSWPAGHVWWALKK